MQNLQMNLYGSKVTLNTAQFYELTYMPSLTPWGKTSRNSDVSHGLTPWAVKLTESKNPIEKKS